MITMYPTAPFIAPEPRVPGFHDVLARVTWTPRHGGEAVTTTDTYLASHTVDGKIFLGCGIEMLMSDLGLDPNISDAEHFAITVPVNRQLLQHPWAELICPDGFARLDVLPWTSLT